jgi:hypothetical protein
MNSCSVLAGTEGLTTRKNGTWPTPVIGCRSRTGSYGMAFIVIGAMDTSGDAASSSV